MPSDTDVEFGQIAVRHKLITRKQHDEAFKILKKLEAQLRKTGKLKKKRPRLVDVLVQKDMLTGSEAKSVENARLFRQIRLDDKLYARIALKSKFCSQDDITEALDKQKKRYLGGKSPKRLFEFLVSKGTLSDEEHEAIEEAIAKLDAREYVARDKGKASSPSEESELDLEDEDGDGDGSDVEELGSDLEEIDDDDLEEVEVEELSGSGVDLDIEDDEAVESLDNDSEVDELDSDIDVRLSGLEGDIDDLSDLDEVDDQDDTNSPPPRGLSSDLDLDGDDDDDDDDDAEDLDDDLDLEDDDDDDDDDDDGSDLDLDDDDDDDMELDDIDLEDSDL